MKPYIEDKEFVERFKNDFNVDGFEAAQAEADFRKRGAIVLAFEKDALRKGGLVMMADGRAKQMTADELRSSIKQKK